MYTPGTDIAFDKAATYVLQNEGGFSDNPDDRGGMTAYGITRQTYSIYLGREATDADMHALDHLPLLVRDVYHALYWLPLRNCFAGVALPIAIAIFDVAVTSGQRTAVALAQRVAGCSPPDGMPGPKTLAALQMAQPEVFLRDWVAETTARYVRIATAQPSQLKFLQGWVARANRVWSMLPVGDAA